MGAVRAFLLVAGLLLASTAIAQPAMTDRVQQLLQRAGSGEPVRVIVGVRLDEPFQVEGEFAVRAHATEQRARIADSVGRVSTLIGGLGSHVHRKFEFIPYLAAEVDTSALQGLMNSPWVTSIEEDALDEPSLAESVPVIGGTFAWSAGLTGTGWTVAVLDTGVDKTHPFLAGKVVSEACYSTTSADSQSLCPGGASSSTAPDSGMDCTQARCGHGTHVAGIVAGLNASGGFSGVAKDASLIAIKVFSYVYSVAEVRTYVSDQIEGLERVLQLRSTYNIASVNMSLGGGQYFNTCDASQSARKAAIDNLRSVGIAVVVSSGNESYRTSMGAPACISSAVSVGATCDAGPDSNRCQTGIDGVASYSNIASFITLVAPGSYINSSVQGGGYESWNGTSMAAPHVAGAWALLKQQNPSVSVSDAVGLLRGNAVTINDTRSGGTVTGLKRMDLDFLAAGNFYALTVSKAGTGTGAVTSNPAGINCGADCSESYLSGTSVTLTATAAAGSTFAGWSGACTATAGTCAVSMTQARSVTATFNVTASSYTLTVSKAGAGSGTVTSSPAGINCGSTCSASFTAGTVVTLTASAAAGSVFSGWSGACTGSGACIVSMSLARNVTANFVPSATTFALSVARAGAGTGTVSSNPAGINCGSVCTANFAAGTAVTLTAAPAAGSTFAGWGGDCTGASTSTVIGMTAVRNCTARFDPLGGGISLGQALDNTALTWTTGGNASWYGQTTVWYAGGSAAKSGTISDDQSTWVETRVTGPGVLSFRWKVSSEEDFDYLDLYIDGYLQDWISGEVDWTLQSRNIPAGVHTIRWVYSKDVNLTEGSDAGWLDQVVWTPTATSFLLTVAKAGAGSGTVSSSPAGINCGLDCSESYNSGTNVTLTAAPAAGSTFVGWSGAGCSGVGTCTVSMTQARSVTATFEGSITSTPLVNGQAVAVSGATGSFRYFYIDFPSGGRNLLIETRGGAGDVDLYVRLGSEPTLSEYDCWSAYVGNDDSCYGSAPPSGRYYIMLYGYDAYSGASLSASYSLPNSTVALSITRTGTGSGTVTSDPAGISCGAVCDGYFAPGTSVTLTATPAVESTFTGWSGACSGTGTCTLSMTQARSAGAAFSFTPKTTEKIASLYVGFFFRAPDAGGLTFWKGYALASSLGDLALMKHVAAGFAMHPSFTSIYGFLNNEAFVDAIYLNVAGKKADVAGKAYWVGRLNTDLSRSGFVAEFLYYVLELTEADLQDMYNRGQITWIELQDALARKGRVANKIEVSRAFVEALGSATNMSPGTDPNDPVSLNQDPVYRASQNIIRSVTEDPVTMVPPLNYLEGDPTIDGINQLFGP